MKHLTKVVSSQHASFYLVIALASAVGMKLVLYVNGIGEGRFFGVSSVVEKGVQFTSMLMLVGVLFSLYLRYSHYSRQSEAGEAQIDALIGMFRGVKHKLNNDMQVIVGNAELAEILMSNKGDISKPVRNISLAANDAIERIEQLSVFGFTCRANPKPIDLNAMFRESMASLADELPSIVTLRLELEPLSARVVADHYLLSLSLMHLVRLAASSMPHGGEVVIRTSGGYDRDQAVSRPAVARIFIVRALRYAYATDSQRQSLDSGFSDNCADELEIGLRTSKALVERSGAHCVQLVHNGDESSFTMHFGTEAQAMNQVRDDLLISHLYS